MISVKDIGEFGLIKKISQKVRDKRVVVGIGDDTAVVKNGKNYLLYTVDAQVEGDHFSRKWFNSEEIGKKAMEVNVSDIAAMGGVPSYALVSMILPKATSVDFVDKLYKGFGTVCKKYNFEIIGGNVSSGKQIVIDIMIIGETNKEDICLRSGAKVGDIIMVSGALGASRCGLRLFMKKIKGFDKIKKKYLKPEAKLKKIRKNYKHINSMIDISDGLASEIGHICEASQVGAIIYEDKIPIYAKVKEASKIMGEGALDYALYGGEDFELVYTVSKKNISKVGGIIIGEIIDKGIYITSQGRKRKLNVKGYDHFKTNLT